MSTTTHSTTLIDLGGRRISVDTAALSRAVRVCGDVGLAQAQPELDELAASAWDFETGDDGGLDLDALAEWVGLTAEQVV